jgi:hypothetical protein
MEQELLILPELPWFIVEFVNTTGDTNGSVTRRVHELYYQPGMLRKD